MSKDSIKNTFIEVFEPAMFNKGFKRKGNVFHRIVNDKIVQLLSYYKYNGQTRFTIEFSILPLCFNFKLYTFYAGTRLSSAFREYVRAWEYENADPKGYIRYMPIALRATEDLLFPKFDAEIDYKSCYENDKNTMLFNSELGKMSFHTYIYNLVLGNYEELEAREDYFQYWNEVNIKNYGTEYDAVPERQKEFEEDRQDYYRIKEAVAKGDKETINTYIASLEKKSLDSYVKNYSTPKKYEKYLEDGILPFDVINISHTSNPDSDKAYQEMLLRRKAVVDKEIEAEKLESERLAAQLHIDEDYIRRSDIAFARMMEKMNEKWTKVVEDYNKANRPIADYDSDKSSQDSDLN